jgi:deoxyribose-phosphate aldolase
MPRRRSREAFDFSAPSVDAVGVEERVQALAKRSIKKSTKIAGLKLVVQMMDLTTLEGKDTPAKVRALSARARSPLGTDGTVGSCAAVCVYPSMVPTAKRTLAGSKVKVASVATAFPSGQSPLAVKLEEVRRTVECGADEIDMVIDRGAMLSGDYARVFDEIAQTKEACGGALLKVILETGELGTYDTVRRASDIGIAAGADFIKTSTGKVSPAATPAVVLVMLHAIFDHYHSSGRKGRSQGGRRRAHGKAGASLPCPREGDLRGCVADAGPLSLRREYPLERRAHAARERADGCVPG